MAYIGYKIFDVLIIAADVYGWVVFLSAILGWFLPPENTFRAFVSFVSEPVVSLFRRLSMRLMARSSIPLDLSPIFAMVALMLFGQLLSALQFWIFV